MAPQRREIGRRPRPALSWHVSGVSRGGGPGILHPPPRARRAGGPGDRALFAPDSGTLYVAGWSKTVQVWRRGAANGELEQDRKATLRVPIGPGAVGVINATSLSSDGRWLAVGGQGARMDAAGYFRDGFTVPYDLLPEESKRDRGQITVFPAGQPAGAARHLRGHLNSVQVLAFAPVIEDLPHVLASLAFNDVDQDIELELDLWDVDAAKSLMPDLKPVSVGRFQPSKISLPQMLVRRLGEDRSSIEVAFALGDKNLRIWDSATRKVHETASPSWRIRALGWLDDRSLATVGMSEDGDAINVQCWRRGSPASPYEMVNHGRMKRCWNETPLSLSVLTFGMEENRAVVLLEVPQEKDGSRIYRLREATLDKNLGARWLEPPIDLGRAPREFTDLGRALRKEAPVPPPALCISPDETKLAISYGRDHEVRIHDFSPGGRVRLNPKPSQVLKSAGRRVRQAFFVQHRKDGGNQGLKFSEAVMDQQKGASPPPRQWVMDFQARAVREETSDWVPAYGDPAREQDWTVEERKDSKGLGLAVRVGPSTLRIPLPYINRPTALALLPAVGGSRPLVAVAGVDGRAPLLFLHDGTTGRQLQWLQGHGEEIRSLQFNPPGNWLVSTSDDRTACLWRIKGLEGASLRKKIEGIYYSPEDLGVWRVDAVNPRSANGQHKRLERGDRIVGIVRKDGPLSFVREEQLHQEIAGKQGTMTLLVRRGGNPEEPIKDVSLDEDPERIRPELTLFFPEPEDGGQRPSWIAWTPNGDYDFLRGLKVHELLGWQKNPKTREGGMPSFDWMDDTTARHRTSLLPSVKW